MVLTRLIPSKHKEKNIFCMMAAHLNLNGSSLSPSKYKEKVFYHITSECYVPSSDYVLVFISWNCKGKQCFLFVCVSCPLCTSVVWGQNPMILILIGLNSIRQTQLVWDFWFCLWHFMALIHDMALFLMIWTNNF